LHSFNKTKATHSEMVEQRYRVEHVQKTIAYYNTGTESRFKPIDHPRKAQQNDTKHQKCVKKAVMYRAAAGSCLLALLPFWPFVLSYSADMSADSLRCASPPAPLV